MSISRLEFQEMERRVAANRKCYCQKCGERISGLVFKWGDYATLCGLCLDDLENKNGPKTEATAVDDEGELHRQIMAWCDSQWPRVKYRHSRMDRPTREELGVEDFSVFLSGNRTLHIEAKTKNRKQSQAQLAWAAELARLGHTVHIIRDLTSFVELALK
jgi:hypothetical protein